MQELIADNIAQASTEPFGATFAVEKDPALYPAAFPCVMQNANSPIATGGRTTDFMVNRRRMCCGGNASNGAEQIAKRMNPMRFWIVTSTPFGIGSYILCQRSPNTQRRMMDTKYPACIIKTEAHMTPTSNRTMMGKKLAYIPQLIRHSTGKPQCHFAPTRECQAIAMAPRRCDRKTQTIAVRCQLCSQDWDIGPLPCHAFRPIATIDEPTLQTPVLNP
jgi:hypothetical protein